MRDSLKRGEEYIKRTWKRRGRSRRDRAWEIDR